MPSKHWIEDSTYWRGEVLQGKYSHWCPDWDFLPIDETTPEFSCCSCGFKEWVDKGRPDENTSP